MKSLLLLIISVILFSCAKKKTLSDNSKKENLFHVKAREFRNAKISDSAFYYYTLAKDEYIKNNDSLRAGQSLINMAIIETAKGDFYGSIETSLEANKFLTNIKDSIVRRDLASSFNNMGIASGYMYNYNDAIDFYKNAIQYATNDETKFTYYNNIGVAFLKKNEAKQAIRYFKNSILSKNKVEYARALNNFARAKFMEDKNYNPLPEFYKALEIRKKSNDIDGLNSSYYTLSEYFKTFDKSKALFYTEKMLETAIAVKNPEDKLQALIKLIDLNTNNISIYFKDYQKLNDSLLIARSKAKNQFALIRYETEKNKADFLRSEAQNAQKEIQLLRQYLISSGLVATLIIIIILYSKRQKKLKQEKELEVKNTQLKLSKKVHDVVANGIYQVMTKIENQESFSKDEALDELEFVYEKSRDISYEKTDLTNNEKNFNEKISELIGSFNNDTVKTYLAGNDASIWNGLQESTLTEVYQIVRELLVNMKKHSRADRVVFRFERENEFIKIYYTDNGIGIPGEIIYKNGLSSTVSRIETIKGEIIFDTKTERGLKINISFPVS